MGITKKVEYAKRETVTYDLDTTVDFGMFKGKTCREILGFSEGARGANWLDWAHSTIPWFDITAELEEAISDNMDTGDDRWYGGVDPYDFCD